MIVPASVRALPSGHRAALEAAFGPLRADPGSLPPGRPMLFLCFTNRCGSNYLAQLLASTGAFNEAGEFFNAETVLAHAASLGLRSLHAYFAALPGLVPARPFLAAKASADQLAILADAGLLAADAQYVLLERQDRLAQAVSRVIASQNARWTTAHPATRPDESLVYDGAAIAREMEKIAYGNAALYAFFAANGVVPVHVTYEALERNPQEVVDLIATRMGAAGLKIRCGDVTIGRQSGALNAAWIQRFRNSEQKKESTSF